MRSVNIAELKNRLSTYIGFAKNGEEIIIRDRDLAVAKLMPMEPGDIGEDERWLVAHGKMTLPRRPLTPEALEEFFRMPRPAVKGNAVVQALLNDREEGW